MFTGLLDGMIIDLQILKPLAEEAYTINKLIERYRTKEISANPETLEKRETFFTESSRLTLWMMSCYTLHLKNDFRIIRSCCKSNSKAINIPTRGMIQFLLIKISGLIMSWMIIQCHGTCIKEQEIESVPSTLAPLVDEIYSVVGKYLYVF